MKWIGTHRRGIADMYKMGFTGQTPNYTKGTRLPARVTSLRGIDVT